MWRMWEPHGTRGHGVAWLTRHFERTADNLDGLLPGMFRRAGLDNVAEMAHYNIFISTLTPYREQRPR